MSDNRLHVLLVGDEASLEAGLASYLRQMARYAVEIAETAEAALARIDAMQGRYHVVFVPARLVQPPDAAPKLAGIALMARSKVQYPSTEWIICTAGERDVELAALHAGAFRYARTPLDYEEVAILIEQAGERCLAQRAAIAIAPTRLGDQPAVPQAEQRMRSLEAIQEISRAIRSLHHPADIMEATCRTAVELFGVEHSGMVLFEDAYERGRVVAEYPDLGTRGVEIPIRNVSPEETVIASGEPLVIEDVAHMPELGPVLDVFRRFDICSIVIMPVVFQGRVLGTFSLDSIGRRRVFSESELYQSRIFATQVAVAIENAQLMTEIGRRAHQLEAVRQTTLAITSQLDGNLLGTIVQQAVALLGANNGGIYEYRAEQGELAIIADHGRAERLLGKTLRLGQGAAGRLVASGAAYLIVDDYSTWQHKAAIYNGVPFGAVVEVPLRWQERILGVLYIDDVVGRKFTDADADLLRLFADHAAIALVNAKLLARDADKLKRLELLVQANSELMSNLGDLHPNERLTLIARYATQILGAEACGIALTSRPGFLRLEANYGHQPGRFEKGREFAIRTGEQTGLTGHIAYERKLLNAYGDKLLQHPARGAEQSHTESGEIFSLLAIPLIKHTGPAEQLLGLLRVDNKKGPDGKAGPSVGFTQEDEWILQLFADAAVVAIEDAYLVARLSEQTDLRKRLIESSPNCVIAVDTRGHITAFSAQAQEVLGYSEAEVDGQFVGFLYDDPQEARRVGDLLQVAGGKLTNHESFVRSKAGERIPIRLAATWLFDAQGLWVGSVGYFEDLRSIKETEQRLNLLLRASNLVAQANNLTSGLQGLAEMLVTLLDMSFCRILLLDTSRQSLVAKASYPAPSSAFVWQPRFGERMPVAEWPELAALLNVDAPRFFSTSTPHSQPFLEEWSRRLELEAALQSLLVVPLRTKDRGDRVVGLLTLGDIRRAAPDRRPGIWNLATAIADQTAVLIDRHSLYEIAERRRQLFTALDEAALAMRAEKEEFALLHDIVRLAAGLIDGAAAGLYVNRPHLEELELQVVFQLPSELIGQQQSHDSGLVAQVARSGKPAFASYDIRADEHEPIFGAAHFSTLIAVPIKQMAKIESVLVVADPSEPQFLDLYLEVLERYAAQAAMALRTARLLNDEQRAFGFLNILHQISDYIQLQAVGDLDKIVHVVLTGITAGYGLGFNRAALLLLDERQEHLVGRLGIGCLNEADALRDWAQHHERKLEDFSQYLELLEQRSLEQTPVGERIAGLSLPVAAPAVDLFARVVQERRWRRVAQDELHELPDSFVEAFRPGAPLVVAPVISRAQVIGLLVVDNKFTRTPIEQERVESLLTFANTLGVAIDNTRLFQEIEISREQLSAFFEASNALVSPRDPAQVLQEIVEQARVTAHASGVSVILIDEIGQLQNRIPAGLDAPTSIDDTIGPEGLSIQVIHMGGPLVIEDTRAQYNRLDPRLFWGWVAAALCLPIYLEGKAIGVMWFYYDRPHHFSNSELEAVRLYVNQAAIGYGSARRIKEMEHMRQAAEALAGAAQLPEVLDQIVRSARAVLHADSAVICSYDSIRNRFIPESSVGSGAEMRLWEQFRKEEPRRGGTASTVMEQGWIGVQDVHDDLRYPFLGVSTRQLLRRMGVQSFQGISLIVGDEQLGVLYVNYNRPRSFSEEERETAWTFAHHAALALKRARLLDQLNRARNAARLVAEVTVLEDLQSTLRAVAEGTRGALDCDAVTMYSYDQHKEQINPPILVGVRYPERASAHQDVPKDSLVFEMLRRERVYIVEDTSADKLFRDARFTREEHIRSCVALSLRVRQETVGVMFVNYRSQHRFVSDELINIELFAHQAAVAIRNAQLYERVQMRAATLRVLYQASSAITSSLDLHEILNRFVYETWRLFDRSGKRVTFANIRLVDHMKARFVAAYPEEELQKAIASVGAELDLNAAGTGPIGVTGRALRTGASKLVPDVSHDPDYLQSHADTRSELAVPIKLDQSIIGVINVEHPHYNAFDQEDKQALEALAAQAAIAIQHARLYEAVRQRGEQFRALYETSLSLTAKLSVEAVLQDVVDRARQLTGARYGALGVFDAEGNTRPFITSGLDRALHAQIGAAPHGSGVLGDLRREAAPLRLPHIQYHTHASAYPTHHPTITSFLGVPIIYQDTCIGNLYMTNKIGAPEFSEEDQEILLLLAAEAAIAIENARLFAQTKKAAERLTAVHQVSRAATSAQMVQGEILRAALQEMVKVFEVNQGGVVMFDWEKGYGQTVSEYPSAKEPLTRIPLHGNPSIEWTVAHKRPLAIEDAVGDPMLTLVRDPIRQSGIKSMLLVPLTVFGEVVGTIGLDATDRVRRFAPDEQDLAQTMANHVASAIENGQLTSKLRAQLEELKQTRSMLAARTAAAWMGMLSSTWQHAIGNHAIVIADQAAALRAELPAEALTPRIEKKLVKIKQMTSKILTKPITPPLSEDDVVAVAVNGLLRERLQQLRSNEPYRSVACSFHSVMEDSVMVRISADWLQRAFDILIDNAVDALSKSVAKHIDVATRRDGGSVMIAVSDTGCGIPDEIERRLFKTQIEKSAHDKGMGMGLLLAQIIVQTYGGEIHIGQTGPTGTTMLIRLPLL